MENCICDVVDRHIKHGYSEEVNQDFCTWLIGGERADGKEYELNKLWEMIEVVTAPDYHDSLEQVHELTEIGSGRRTHSLCTRLMVWQAAAALSITVSPVSIYPTLQGRQAPDLLQAYIPTAETRNTTLLDGIQMLINSQSTLFCLRQFTSDTRCVYPVGGASFKAKRGEEHSFIVKSSDFQVTTLGIKFNVVVYPDEDRITATLTSGRMLVGYNRQKNQEVLNPNERLAYNKRTRSKNAIRPDVWDITAWQCSKVVFCSITLEKIFIRLRRRYPYAFTYSFRSLKGDRLNLTLGQNASTGETMNIVARVTGDLNYQIMEGKCCASAITEGTLHYRKAKQRIRYADISPRIH